MFKKTADLAEVGSPNTNPKILVPIFNQNTFYQLSIKTLITNYQPKHLLPIFNQNTCYQLLPIINQNTYYQLLPIINQNTYYQLLPTIKTLTANLQLTLGPGLVRLQSCATF